MRDQLSRKKGSKINPNGIICDRRSIWGNPYKVIKESNNKYNVIDINTNTVVKGLITGHSDYDGWTKNEAVEISLHLFELDVSIMPSDKRKEWLKPLVGKTLLCWCKKDDKCHCDILLKYLKYDWA